jgi:hypothetical protein
MFEKFINERTKLEKNKISVPVNADEDGYLDRECPNEECYFSSRYMKKIGRTYLLATRPAKV